MVYEKYKPTTNPGQSPTFSKDKYGFTVENINVTGDYAKDYIGYCKYINKYESSLDNRKSRLRCAIPFIQEARKTDVLNAEVLDLETYVKYCINELRNREGTINLKLTTFGNLIKHIHTRCNPPSRPNLTYAMIKDIDVNDYGDIRPRIQRKPLTREEVDLLIDGAGNQGSYESDNVTESRYPHRDQLIVTVLYETGLRNSDLRGLKLDDYNPNEKLIIVKGSKGDHKSEISYRVPVRETLNRKLRHWIDVGRPAFLGDKETESLFPSNQGNGFKCNRSIIDIVQGAAKRAGIGGELTTSQSGDKERSMALVTPHILRHSIITHLDSELEDDLQKILLGNAYTLDDYRHNSSHDEEFEEIRTTLHGLH